MLKNIEIYILLFFIYSILGWIMEVTRISIKQKKFVNRGFLTGPYCPIYGYGVLLITILLKNYQSDYLVTFIFSIIICGLLEYLTSYFMEKIFHARWWDYSNRRFNINGRICLETLIPFGILGCIIIYFANPFFINTLEKLPDVLLTIVSVILTTAYILDNIISIKIVSNLKSISMSIKDNTEEISKKVKEVILNKLSLYRRVLEAYPLIKTKIDLKEFLSKGEEKIKNIRNK